MSARQLFEVALRILGVWFVLSSITTMTMTASLYLSGGLAGTGVNTARWVFASGVNFLIEFVIGLGLILYAPVVTGFCYRKQDDAEESEIRIGPGDIYHVACFVLGAFVFVKAAEPAGRMVNAGFQGSNYGMAGDAFTMIAYMSAGLLLVFGARRIGEGLSRMKYDPDSIVDQQISVRILLVLTALVAVALGVARWLALRSN